MSDTTEQQQGPKSEDASSNADFELDETNTGLAEEAVFEDVSLTHSGHENGKDEDSDGRSQDSCGEGSKSSKESKQSSQRSQQSKASNDSGYSAGSPIVTKVSDVDSFYSAQDSIESNSVNNDSQEQDYFNDIKRAFEANNNFKFGNFLRLNVWRRRRRLSPTRPENIDLELSWEEPKPMQDASSQKPSALPVKQTDHTKRQMIRLASLVCGSLMFLVAASWASIILAQSQFKLKLFKSQFEMKLFNSMLRQSGKNDAALEAVLISAINHHIGIGRAVLRFDVEQRFLITVHLDGTNGAPIPTNHGTWQLSEGTKCTFDGTNSVTILQNNPLNEEKFPQGRNVWAMDSPNSVSAQTRYVGKSMDELTGNALVLFDENQGVIACGMLRKIPRLSVRNVLWAYPGMDGIAQGKVRLDFYNDNSFHVGFNFSTPATGNVLPGATQLFSPLTIENYDSCAQVTHPNFFFPSNWTNPWTMANGAYYSEKENNHGYYMYDGYSYEEHIGKTIVMRDAITAAVLACGELQRDIDLSAAVNPYEIVENKNSR